ncbi:hypothetical protein [Paraburkholderia caribensis]|uniref:hypothetical protein n=1 Tax=Paraburkholderia caribensis TaxID=75105 RepID=UPI0028586C2B|nr:hypothetical protein [Paraburkholderia caribensis]MDR6381778.1 Zn finger protein HypA/HybF involved in hydrogenase expression [Paraburkholderia caribensis]
MKYIFSTSDRHYPEGVHVHIMTPPAQIDCAMCDAVGDWLHCVPYYCGPVAEGCSEGGYRAVCPSCHERWSRWNDSLHYYGA